jgi:hypothetical protein
VELRRTRTREADRHVACRSAGALRLSIVVVVLSLMASVLIEQSHVDCWQESISAYFYTPAQAMFVAALVVIGVSLIAIKGSTDWETCSSISPGAGAYRRLRPHLAADASVLVDRGRRT